VHERVPTVEPLETFEGEPYFMRLPFGGYGVGYQCLAAAGSAGEPNDILFLGYGWIYYSVVAGFNGLVLGGVIVAFLYCCTGSISLQKGYFFLVFVLSAAVRGALSGISYRVAETLSTFLY